MQHYQLPFEKTNAFSSLFLEYFSEESKLSNFIDFEPSAEGLRDAVDSWKFDDSKRNILVEVLKKQNISKSDGVCKNIELLENKNTFTVTTGHQLNLVTGPLYFIYKIISTIKLAEYLTKEFPDKNFVPVYWMASEDHDFQEINHFHLFGKKNIWETNQKGAVGAFSLEGVDEVLDNINEAFL